MRVEQPCQCRRNHRIKHIVVRGICSPQIRSRCHKFDDWLCLSQLLLTQCIVRWGPAVLEHTSVLKLTFQLWNSMKVWELSQMHVRDWKSRVIHHTTVRISPPAWLRIPPLWKRGTVIDEFCGSRLIPLSGTIVFPAMSGLNPQEDDAKLFEFSKRAERGWSFSSRYSFKKVSWSTLNNPCVPCANPESRQGIDLGLGIVKGSLGTWDAPELLAASGS